MPIEYESCGNCPNFGGCEDYDPDHPHRCRLVSCDVCGKCEDDIDGDMYELEDGSVICSKYLITYLIEQHIIRPCVESCSHPDECMDCPNDGSDPASIPVRSWYVKKTKERVCDEFLSDYLEENDIIDRIS